MSLSDGAGDWKCLPSSLDEIRLAVRAAAAEATSVPRLVPSHVSPRGTAVARGARWWLWGTEPGSWTGAPDHFSNSRFRFSFASGCVRVRPIFIPSSDSEPGFRFLLSHCTEGEGLYPPLGLRCLLPHPQIHPHRAHFMLPFLREGGAQLLVSPPRSAGIATCTGERLPRATPVIPALPLAFPP